MGVTFSQIENVSRSTPELQKEDLGVRTFGGSTKPGGGFTASKENGKSLNEEDHKEF